MPERVHTKFSDEPKSDLINPVNPGSPSMPPGNSSPKSGDAIQISEPTQPLEKPPPQGIKRSREGTPKSSPASGATVQATVQSTVEEEGEQTANGDKSKMSKSTISKAKEQDDVAIKPRKFYSNSHIFTNGTSPTKASNERNGVVKGALEVGRTTYSGSHRSTPITQASLRQRPSPQVLKKLKQGLLKTRQSLPIWSHKSDIRWGLRNSDVLLLIGETGSGKSTQVPQFLTSEPWFRDQRVMVSEDGNRKEIQVGGMIAVTEPRRVAAISLAYRVAEETGSCLGRGICNDFDAVGYAVRFDSLVPRSARIKFLTEGMLLQELLHDPHLRNYSAVIIDEIHERSVDVDLLAGFLKTIVRGDKSGRGGVPLKLVIMSATANMGEIQKFFSIESPLIEVTPPVREDHDKKNGDRGDKTGLDTLDQLNTPEVNGINGVLPSDNPPGGNDDSVSRSNDQSDRRVSDASYSSWDGIHSGDEAAGKQDDPNPPSSQNGSNGHRSHRPSNSEVVNGVPSLESQGMLNNHIQINGVTVHHIKGRQHPVKIFYTPEPVSDYIEAMLKTIFKVHIQEALPGDLLCFLTGQEEIESLHELVEQYAQTLNKALPKVKVVCLYGHLSNEQQQEAFAPVKDKKTRKVVLATNIAETSVTVPGVRIVIDCGKAKIKQYRSRLGLQSLLIKPISKSSAIQRKGRAGREAPGKCYRLYTETEYLKLQDEDFPEILRSDIVEAVLRMKARGVRDVMSFPLLDLPAVDSLEKALFTLHSIGALDDEGELNDRGRKMANFPLPPAYGRVLVAAAESHSDCLLEAIDAIACITASDDVFVQPKSDEKREEVEEARSDLLRREGDIITYLTVMQKYTSENVNRLDWCERRMVSSHDMKQAISIRRQLREMCLKQGMLAEKPEPDPQPFVPISAERAEVLLKCFMKAFATKTAILQPDGRYSTTLGKNVVTVHPSSVLHGRKMEAILFLEQVYTQKNYARKVSGIQMNWIAEALEIA